MKYIIRLIDLGLDDGFGKAMTFAQSVLDSMNVSGAGAEVEYVRSSAPRLIVDALVAPADMIHVMSHGGTCEHGTPGFGSVKDNAPWLDLVELEEYLQQKADGIKTAAIFADACDSAQSKFAQAIRGSIVQDTAYIGASRRVDWRECTTFGSILYGSILRAKGKGIERRDWIVDAAERSIGAYEQAVDGPCPFKAMTLSPSREAKKAFTVQNSRGEIA